MNGERVRLWMASWGVPLAAAMALLGIAWAGANEPLFLACNALSRYTGDALWANWTVLGDATVVLALSLPFAGRRPDVLWALLLAALLTTLSIHSFKPLLATQRHLLCWRRK